MRGDEPSMGRVKGFEVPCLEIKVWQIASTEQNPKQASVSSYVCNKRFMSKTRFTFGGRVNEVFSLTGRTGIGNAPCEGGAADCLLWAQKP